jgi:hypothetical protein
MMGYSSSTATHQACTARFRLGGPAMNLQDGPVSVTLVMVDQYGRVHGVAACAWWTPQPCRIARGLIRMSLP